MLFLGILIGFGEIVLGIIILVSSHGEGLIIGAGIGYILSGLLYIWLCSGATQAFTNEKRINELKWKVRELEIKNNISLEMLKKSGLSDETINNALLEKFIGVKRGQRLIALVAKRMPDGNTVISKDSIVLFDHIENLCNGSMKIHVKVDVNGQKIVIPYKEDEVQVEIIDK